MDEHADGNTVLLFSLDASVSYAGTSPSCFQLGRERSIQGPSPQVSFQAMSNGPATISALVSGVFVVIALTKLTFGVSRFTGRPPAC